MGKYFVLIFLLSLCCEIRKVRSSSIHLEKDVDVNQTVAGGDSVARGDVNQSEENVTNVECGDVSCLNGGLCIDEHCICPSEYYGKTCDKKDSDPCVPTPCLNEGKCVEYEGSYWCLCEAGYVGNKCETGICDPNPCFNGGICSSKGGQFYCDCTYDYTGTLCNETLVTHTVESEDKDLDLIIPELSDPCDPNPCMNNGNCVEYEDSFWCLCEDGFSGDRCEKMLYSTSTEFETTTEIDCSIFVNEEMSNNGKCVCKRGYVRNESGTCVECNCGYRKDSSPFDCVMSLRVDIRCLCPNGYVEHNNKCVACDCGGGTYPFGCQYTSETKVCKCPFGFFQLNETCIRSCETDVECQNGGSCRNSEVYENKRCYCPGSYTGDRCEGHQLCQSLEASCDKIGAVCRLTDGEPNCVCPPKTAYDWEKSRCENVCKFDTCVYGTCEALTTTFECRCWAGYSGIRCEQKEKTSVVGEITSQSLILTIVVSSIAAILLFLIVTIVICVKMRKKF